MVASKTVVLLNVLGTNKGGKREVEMYWLQSSEWSVGVKQDTEQAQQGLSSLGKKDS